MLTSLRVKEACIEKLKRYLMLGNLLPWLEARQSYAKKKPNGNKGLNMVKRVKKAVRKVFVNGLFMRKASVLKQNKYREK